MHNPNELSAIYYVSAGKERLPGACLAHASHASHASHVASPASSPTDGCLVFRGGPITQATSSQVKTSSTYTAQTPPDGQLNGQLSGQQHSAALSYVRVEPVPGTLLVFPGGVPHMVMGMEDEPEATEEDSSHPNKAGRPSAADRQAKREARRLAAWNPRISIAINFFEGNPKTPRLQ